MASLQGITVKVISGGVPLTCYDDPDETTIRKSEEVRKYIEAVTDAKFMVAFHLAKGFDMGHCDGIMATYVLDGHRVLYTFVNKEGFAANGNSYMTAHGASGQFCAASRTWRHAAWSFGKLDIQDAADVGTSRELLKNLGSITLSVQRVMRLERPVPYDYKHSEKARDTIESVPEKLLKGQAISNKVNFMEGPLTSRPGPAKWKYVPISGAAGAPMDFTFLYRSKHALQIIGCIPRSPSPDPAIELPPRETGRQSAVPKPDPTPDLSTRDGRISALKAQLARLERSPKVESEAVASASDSANARGVKREYADVEIFGERKRNRPLGPIETVDLTED